MKEEIEKLVKSTRVYSGKIFDVDHDEIEVKGQNYYRDIIRHNGGAAILAIDTDGKIFLVSQYRYALNKVIYELPAGKREKDEDPFLTARRELTEEIGMEAAKWVSLGSCYSSPGCFTEEIFLYLATDLTKVVQHLDEDEYLSVHKFTLAEILDMIKQNQLIDGKSQLAILKYLAFIKQDNK